LKFLTFALAMIMLERCVVWYPLTCRDKVCDHATGPLCAPRISDDLVPFALLHAAGNPRVAAPSCGLSTDRLSATPPADGSLALGLALVCLAQLARRLGICTTAHGCCLAEEAVPRLLAAAQSARQIWSGRDLQRGSHTHQGHVAIQSHVGLASNRRELEKLGIHVAKSTVEKYRPRFRKPLSPTWKAFLHNHVKDLVSCDFFTVPTVTYKVLFVFVILAHERRRIVHFNVTEHPTAQWTAQQMVEAFPWDEAPRYLLHDRDSIYGEYFQQRVKTMGIEEVTIAPRSPWQNPYVERLIGSIRRECLNDVIVLHEQHLKRVLHAYVAYYHCWRTHRSLEMDAPVTRPVQGPELGSVHKMAEVGGIHHHYERRAA
jgi:putative transposase